MTRSLFDQSLAQDVVPTPSGKQTPVPRKYEDIVIRASAGTGKTYQLTNRYIGQLTVGAEADQILATTFTRKAAGEILSRVLVRLARAAVDEDARRELGQAIDVRQLSPRQCLKLLSELTRNLHRIQICTLDSFFGCIARSFGLDLGLPPGWRVLEDQADQRLRVRAVENVLRKEATNEITRMMHLLAQGDAERSVSERVGNTVRDLYRVFQETDEAAWRKIPEDRMLADDELLETIAELEAVALPEHVNFRKAHTQLCNNASCNQWEQVVENGLIKKVMAGESKYHRKTIPDDAVRLYLKLCSHARGYFLKVLANQTSATFELLSRFDGEYERLKRDARGLRFDDVCQRIADVADRDGMGRLGYRIDTQLRHLLLDEFQDTSQPQWKVLRPLAREVSSGESGKSFFCVGDVKQAIYRWRGGVAEIFDALDHELDGLNTEPLDKSFRSSQPIIDTVNQIFSRLNQHTSLERIADAVFDWAAKFSEHTTAKTDLPGYACLRTAPATDDNDDAENSRLRYTANYVKQLVRESPGASVGVLTRTNKAVARLIFELKRVGIPASEEGGNPLTDSAAVQAILSLLKLADHPGDRIARFHVASSPLGESLGFTDFEDDVECLKLAKTVRASLMDEGYGPTIYQWVVDLADACNRRDLSRLQQLVALAYAYENNVTLRTTDFLNFVRNERVSDPTGDDVRVMTVHQSKGLQFDIVVLPDLEKELLGSNDAVAVGSTNPAGPIDFVCLFRNEAIRSQLPSQLQDIFDRNDNQRVAEALCLLYVAVTRPVHALHMIVDPALRKRQRSKTFRGFLLTTLNNGDTKPDGDQVLYEHGDAQWHQSWKSAELDSDTAELASRTQPEQVKISLAPMPDGRRRGLKRIAPSSKHGHRKTKLSSVLRFHSAKALERGTLIHRWFEEISWMEDGWPDDASLRELAEEAQTKELDLDTVLGEFHAMLRMPKVAFAMSKRSYCPPRDLNLPPEIIKELSEADLRLEVINERRFAVRQGSEVVSGSIDRLVLMYSGFKLIAADILDFKTDTLSPHDRQAQLNKVDNYRGQLESYRPAVSQIYRLPIDRISARLVMVSAGVVESI
ncbi:MAG: hypothetical protein CMJ78_17805 [Planctomycetaceae bacterium]|nr:hypothetical protein [Planctomycetaceae bacterium]